MQFLKLLTAQWLLQVVSMKRQSTVYWLIQWMCIVSVKFKTMWTVRSTGRWIKQKNAINWLTLQVILCCLVKRQQRTYRNYEWLLVTMVAADVSCSRQKHWQCALYNKQQSTFLSLFADACDFHVPWGGNLKLSQHLQLHLHLFTQLDNILQYIGGTNSLNVLMSCKAINQSINQPIIH